jgi:O-antigen/teichoic acid export membrane protein
MLITLAIETFRRAWWPVAMDAMHGPEGAALYRTVARLYVGVGAAGIVILSALSPWLVRTFTAPAFHEAQPLVGVLAWSSVLYGFFMIGGSGIWKAEKTWLTSVFMLAGGAVNIALAWWWSAMWGAMGAALALVAAYSIWIALTVWASERLWKVGFPWLVLCLQAAGGGACGWLIYWMRARGDSEALVWLIAIVAAALLVGSALDERQRGFVWRNLCRFSFRS